MVAKNRFLPAVAAATVAWISSPVSSLNVGHSARKGSTTTTSGFASISPSVALAHHRRGGRRRGVVVFGRVTAVSAVPAAHQDDGDRPGGKHGRSGWHRNVIKKVFRKNKKGTTSLQETSSNLIEDPSLATPEFLLQNFDAMSPSSLFGTAHAPPSDLATFNLSDIPMLELQDTSFEVESLEDASLLDSDALLASNTTDDDSTVIIDDDDDAASTDSESEGRSPLTRITSSVAENILTGLVDRLSKGAHANLSIKCAPNGNAYDLLRGHFQSDASVQFDRLVLPCMRMSGGRLEAHRLAINLWSFTPSSSSFSSTASSSQTTKRRRLRYPNQFDFVAHDMTFTQDDLFQSNCIRNGLRRLLIRVLKNHMTLSSVAITSIKILASGKIAIRGQGSTGFAPPVPFEVRSFLDFSSRGHVLTFPGLEISLGPTLMFVPVLPEVSLDLGHNAQLLQLHVDGEEATMRVSARATITPHHTLKISNYVQAKDSYLAPFSVDVGRWLTKVGNFTH
jgi:hypothetical protein